MPMRVVCPQHFTDPFSNSAQLWLSPSAVFVMFSATPVSTNGSSSPISSAWSPMSCVLPIPSWPMSPAPQHFIRSPSSSVVEVPTTHVWLKPTSKTDSLRCRSLFPV